MRILLFISLLLLICTTVPCQTNLPAQEKTAAEQIAENDSLIKAYQAYEDSLNKIRSDANARNLNELVKNYEKRQQDKSLHKAILYIVIGLAMAAVLVLGLLRKTKSRK